ncbi:MAG TPA: FAD-binding oxidoreductase [Sulfuricurvum sp.]|nr:FAD-binding oxidoreductase [Sulfuricurvum sp.]
MPTSKTSPYDVIIVGAGINGCASAYFLHQAGLRVALIDQGGIAGGGSGAAGAFISPKISKEGFLKEIMRDAHLEALDFYTTNFSQYTLQKPLLHIAKDDEDSLLLKHFKQETHLGMSDVCQDTLSILTSEALEAESVCFAQGAIVNAQKVCKELVVGIDFYEEKVESLLYEEEQWCVGKLRGGHIVLAIGAYPKLLPLPYLNLRGIWGHRIDIETSTDLSCILHHHVSVSPTSQAGIMAIGATHDIHFSPFESIPYDVEKGRVELLKKASKTLKLNNIEIHRDYAGLRSGSNDYIPMLGPLVDAQATLDLYPHLQHGEKISLNECVHYPNLTMINGSGGYGFVLAPYLALRLKEFLVKGKALDERLSPSRFFLRWAKRKKD